MPPSKRRAYAVTEDDVEQRSKQILEHAAKAVTEDGMEGCTFVRVSESSGFSVGMIQHYFRTRDRLIRATIDQRIDEAKAEWLLLARLGDSATDRIMNLMSFAVDGKRPFTDAWGFWIELYACARRDPVVREKINNALEQWRTIFTEVLKEAFAEGRIHPDFTVDEQAHLLMALVDGLATHAVNGTYDTTAPAMRTLLRRHAAATLGIDHPRSAAEFTATVNPANGNP